MAEATSKTKDPNAAVIVQRQGAVDDKTAAKDAKARNDALVKEGVLGEGGFLGVDAAGLSS